jgi:ankyrin repeat protein
MNNENECPVCFCSMDQCEFKLYCGHEIHGKCMFKHAEQYLRLHNNLLYIKIPCPICRSQHHCIEDALRSTIEKGTLEDLKEIITTENVNNVFSKWKLTALHIASGKNKLEMVKYLLEIGANIDMKAKLGHTPLYSSTIFNNYDVFRYLIDNGADVNIRHSSGKTPLDVAVESCFNDMILYIELM